MDLLLKRARVRDDRPPVDIGIAGDRIAAVERTLEVGARRTIDCEGRAVVPGLLEPHLHLEKALLHRRAPARTGTLEEAIRITGELKKHQEREDVMERSRRVLDMALRNGTVAVRAHPDVDAIQGLIGVETALALREEYRGLLDLQIVAFPQEGILRSPGTMDLLEEALRMGAGVVGGCPYTERSEEDSRRQVELVFELAAKYDRPLDLHADFADDTSDPRFATAAFIAQRTIDAGFQGRVSLGHVTSLAALAPEEAAPVLELLARAGIHVITLPATDLYLGGRGDRKNPRRGLTPVRALREAGINVAYSSNNIRNAFTPFGKADPLQIGNLLAHAAQMGTEEEQRRVLEMATVNAAKAMGFAEDYGIGTGRRADLVVLDTARVADAILDLPPRAWVIKSGKVTVTTRWSCEVHRDRS